MILLISEFKERLNELSSLFVSLERYVLVSNDLFLAYPDEVFLPDKTAKEAFIAFIADIYYADHDPDGRFTNSLIGAISLSAEGVETIEKINRVKSEIDLCIKEIKSRIKGRDGKSLSHAGSAKAFRRLLNDVGLGRLSLKKCTRKIPVLHKKAVSIRFSFSKGGRSMSKKTPEQALALLDKSGFISKKSIIAREKIGSLSPSETLVQVQDQAGYYKANIVFYDGERKTIPTSVPLVYGIQEEKPIRQDKIPSTLLSNPRKRKPRSDQKIEDIPLFSSIRLHAYKKS